MPDLRVQAFSVAHVTGEKRPVVFLHVAEAEVERLHEAVKVAHHSIASALRTSSDEFGLLLAAESVLRSVLPSSDQQAAPDEPGRGEMAEVWEIERDRHGVMFSGPLEVGECRRVVPVAEVERLREALIEAASLADEIQTTLLTEPETPAIEQALGWAASIRPLLSAIDALSEGAR